MAVTIFHRIINRNRVRIINDKPKEPETKMIRVSGDIKARRHTITEERNYG